MTFEKHLVVFVFVIDYKQRCAAFVPEFFLQFLIREAARAKALQPGRIVGWLLGLMMINGCGIRPRNSEIQFFFSDARGRNAYTCRVYPIWLRHYEPEFSHIAREGKSETMT